MSWSTSELRVWSAPWNQFKPSSEYFIDRSNAVLLLWIVFVSYASCWCVLCYRGCLLQPCGHLLGKSWPFGCRVCCGFLSFGTFPNVSWSTSQLRARLAPWNWFKPSSKNIFTDRSKAVLLLWIICAIYVLCLSCFRVCTLLPFGHLLGKGWPIGFCLWCLNVFFVTFPCGTLGQVWHLIVSIPDLCRLLTWCIVIV